MKEMGKLKKLAEINAIIDRLIILLEAEIFINYDILENTDTQNKITEIEKDKN
jgi:hypothetical protein